MGAFLLAFLPQLPNYVASGIALADAVSIGLDKANQLKAENREVTDADWDDVNDRIAAKRKQLHAPGA